MRTRLEAHGSVPARATAQLGNYWTLIGARGKAETLAQLHQALGAARRQQDLSAQANVLQAIGAVQQFRKDTTAALGSYQQALGLFRAIGDPEQSQTLLHQALAIREAINDVYSSGADLGNYGIALLQRGRNAEAPLYLERARALFAARGIEELLPQMDALIAQARNGT
jgi:tetratricopeptide (TPR) repeat protein